MLHGALPGGATAYSQAAYSWRKNGKPAPKRYRGRDPRAPEPGLQLPEGELAAMGLPTLGRLAAHWCQRQRAAAQAPAAAAALACAAKGPLCAYVSRLDVQRLAAKLRKLAAAAKLKPRWADHVVDVEEGEEAATRPAPRVWAAPLKFPDVPQVFSPPERRARFHAALEAWLAAMDPPAGASFAGHEDGAGSHCELGPLREAALAAGAGAGAGRAACTEAEARGLPLSLAMRCCSW